jgi:hypothetical protein
VWHLEAYDKKTQKLAKDYVLPLAPDDPFLARVLKREPDKLLAGGFALDAAQVRELAAHIPEPLLPDIYDYQIEYLRD